jgi:acyl-CoA thioester hydrolase
MADFTYLRRVAFSDTDAMGVTHHANYLRYVEEARVAWMRERRLINTHWPAADRVLAVISYRMWHMKPCSFEDQLEVKLQVRRDGLRVTFQYAVFKGSERIAEAETKHVLVDAKLKPIRSNPELFKALENEPWTETWLLNSSE